MWESCYDICMITSATFPIQSVKATALLTQVKERSVLEVNRNIKVVLKL